MSGEPVLQDLMLCSYYTQAASEARIFRRVKEGYLTIREVAALFKVTRRTILNWQHQGLIPYFKIGHTVRFHPDDLQRHLQQHCRIGQTRRNAGGGVLSTSD